MTVSETRRVKCEFCENGQCPITIEMAIDAGDRSMAGGTTTCGNCGGDGWVARAEPSRGAPEAARYRVDIPSETKFMQLPDGEEISTEATDCEMELTAEIELLKQLERSTSPCGHLARYAKTDDGGKHIICLECGHVVLLEALRACVREMEDAASLLKFFPDDYGEAMSSARAAIQQAERI